MKKTLLILFLISSILGCKSTPKNQEENTYNIISEPEDKEILQQVFETLTDEKDTPTATLLLKVGTFFKGTPYIAHTLETSQEQLVVNLREMDCTTFAENCLAITKTIQNGKKTFKHFCIELKNIRYRDGKINGYTSRLHYFSDWIFDNQKKGLVRNVSEEIAHIPYEKKIDFMSTHPSSYKQLKDSNQLVKDITILENKISARSMFYIPEDKIAEVEPQLHEGDIVGLTTGIDGLDMVHVGILVRVEGRIHLLHASSAAKKVIISENTLEDYLQNSKTANGIMVARPL